MEKIANERLKKIAEAKFEIVPDVQEFLEITVGEIISMAKELQVFRLQQKKLQLMKKKAELLKKKKAQLEET